ncbi:hypothetical protein EV189_2282 [Motilibacter rhizosphaerae]|uniref:STAS domain-containing protein n=1 Tax=Motilibacter rhizosphaerae TaxID=598652 RepID=A0A4Q7NPH6_9ACTN|nr:hypothetical protein [Motilibacter rhizosphaerae]RZS86866.1 hypothetical protein EV189_2282 [Motilibacter rhizosphaerae]
MEQDESRISQLLPSQARRPVLVTMGPDGDLSVERQRVAEAVRTSRAGDVIVLDTAAVQGPSVSLAFFLHSAIEAALLRGARLEVLPEGGQVRERLETEGIGAGRPA